MNASKDVLCGLFFVAVGAFFLIYALLTLQLWTPEGIGSGFFPVLLGSLLIVFGAAVAAIASDMAMPRVALRPLTAILVAPIVFGITIRGLGMAAALFLTLGCAAAAIRWPRPAQPPLLIAAIVLLSVALFKYGLGAPAPVFGRWITG